MMIDIDLNTIIETKIHTAHMFDMNWLCRIFAHMKLLIIRMEVIDKIPETGALLLKNICAEALGINWSKFAESIATLKSQRCVNIFDDNIFADAKSQSDMLHIFFVVLPIFTKDDRSIG